MFSFARGSSSSPNNSSLARFRPFGTAALQHSGTFDGRKVPLPTPPVSPRNGDAPADFYEDENDEMEVFVGGLRELGEVSEVELRSHFEQFGTVVRLELTRDRRRHDQRGFCFVTFANKVSSTTCLAVSAALMCGAALHVLPPVIHVYAPSCNCHVALWHAHADLCVLYLWLLFTLPQQSAALACLEQVDHNIRGMQIAVERATRDAAAGKPALKKRTRRSRRPSRTAAPALAVGSTPAATPSSKLSGEHTLPNTPAERAPMSGSTFFSHTVAPPLPPRPVAAAAAVVAPPARSTMGSYAQQWLPYNRDLRSAVVQRPQQQQQQQQVAALHDPQYLQHNSSSLQPQQQQLRQVTTLPTPSSSASSSMWSYLGVRSSAPIEQQQQQQQQYSRAVQQPMPAISKVHVMWRTLSYLLSTAALASVCA
jgi:RNA recognition motif. (a.k.a. RRM, RBD, or RNP domain)